MKIEIISIKNGLNDLDKTKLKYAFGNKYLNERLKVDVTYIYYQKQKSDINDFSNQILTFLEKARCIKVKNIISFNFKIISGYKIKSRFIINIEKVDKDVCENTSVSELYL